MVTGGIIRWSVFEKGVYRLDAYGSFALSDLASLQQTSPAAHGHSNDGFSSITAYCKRWPHLHKLCSRCARCQRCSRLVEQQ